ncbi:hypothetical protein OZX57_00835 [Bifidobacterium sp. ESL0682]|uniref:hypothetical protein n=1 Tax=Bifidobacterium sp. ESL0682 TaxID=2983212 RepID=UPI0023F735A0|nr:hypothetical protein [Bifidobacterium sp. ESL0682]WEV42086.1 hypothetical protein OZX57_00835 [Bifidobacterium sp. ESL0682]
MTNNNQNHQTSGQDYQISGQNHQTSGQNHQTAGQDHHASGQNHETSGQNHQRPSDNLNPITGIAQHHPLGAEAPVANPGHSGYSSDDGHVLANTGSSVIPLALIAAMTTAIAVTLGLLSSKRDKNRHIS